MLTIAPSRVYLALGSTDMRKSISGLSILVEDSLEMNPFSGSLFVFCNRRRSMIKVLYWDRNEFCLWMKRLEKHSFQWPSSPEEVMEIDHRQFRWLLDGLKPHQACAHEPLSYTTLI